MKQVANGFDYKVGTFDKYDINGYHFCTQGNKERRDILKSRNTGVSLFAMESSIMEDLMKYMNCITLGQILRVFKCHWFDPEKVRRRDDIGQVEIRQDSKL